MRIARIRTRFGFVAALGASAVILLAAGSAAAASGPAWRLDSVANTTAAPGQSLLYHVQATNVGDAATDGTTPIVLTATLPAGLSATEANDFSSTGWDCVGNGPDPDPHVLGGASLITCTTTAEFEPHSGFSQLILSVAVAPDTNGQLLTADFAIVGGDASNPAANTKDPTLITEAASTFGIDAFDVLISEQDNSVSTQAGGHPYSFTGRLDYNRTTNPKLPAGINDIYPAAGVKDLSLDLPPGLIGNPTAASTCTLADLSNGDLVQARPLCSVDSQIGTVTVYALSQRVALGSYPAFNMEPPPGVPARIGVNALGTVVATDVRLRSDGDYGVSADALNISEGIAVVGFSFTLWTNPADPSHDAERACPGEIAPFEPDALTCPAGERGVPFLRMPTRCAGPLATSTHIDSWAAPAQFGPDGAPQLADPAWKSRTVNSHELPGYPSLPTEWGSEVGTTGCEDVPVRGKLTAQMTALDTETASGLDVHVEVPNPGMDSNDRIVTSDLKKVRVTLPQGATLNPSQASGLGVCSPAQYESSRLEFHPDGQHGCPSNSKIGTVSVRSPLLDETVPGNVYVAKPYDNTFNSLLAIYIVLEEPERGILVKLPVELRTNEESGRIEAEVDDIPQIPFSSFDFHFREGARAPLVTPSTCGTYETEAQITGWSDPEHPITSKSSFQIVHGIGGAPCPPGGTPGFKPRFSAGSLNNNAGSYSPFNMRIQRADGEQDMTRFSAVLPPGVLGKLAGVAKCPDSAIAAAKAHNGPHGGQEEIDNPSCPAGSEIGHSIVGAGVGSVLTYVPGKVYLGGAFHGDPLSIIAITPVVAGPFDVGTVVVHEALTLNPKTAEVEVDGSASDPIPHILKGIPAKLRDLRVYVDRPDFVLNPTSCDPSATTATLFGGGGNAFSTLDDVPLSLADRFQAASCASLGFKPRLGLKLKGGTKRGGHPSLTATYRPKPGNANAKALVVRLPRSAFLDQAHIRTICTRVQFAADACPKGAQYGYIKAWTPLLEETLQGPVWLRSSNHKLPDLVFDLHGLVDIEVATRIDSIRGGVRASVDSIPDAPLTKVVLKMQGAKKGLIVNSRNLCGGKNRANVAFDGQNGKISDFKPVMQAECGGKRKHKRHHG